MNKCLFKTSEQECIKFGLHRVYFGLIVLSVAISSIFAVNAFAQDLEGIPFITRYSPVIYKANPQNWCAIQDTNGVMYFGNTDGILEYNGAKWKLITTTLKTTVRALALDPDGTVYVGAQGEFGCLKPDSVGQMKFVSLSTALPDSLKNFSDIWKIVTTTKGIYFLASERLFRLNRSNHKIVSWKPRHYFYLDFKIRGKFYVFEPHTGLLTLKDSKLSLVPDGKKFSSFGIYGVFPYPGNKMLICTYKHGMFLYDGKSAKPFHTRIDHFLKINDVYSARMLPDSTYLFTTLRSGVVDMNSEGKIVRVLNKKSGLQDNYVLNSFVDREKNVWLMHENGISKIDWFAPVTYFKDDLYGIEGSIMSILRYKKHLYLATGIGVFVSGTDAGDNLKNQKLFLRVNNINCQVWELHKFNGKLLAATTHGVYEINGTNAVLLYKKECFTLYQSRKNSNSVYAGLDKGVAKLRYINGNWRYESKLPDIDNQIRSIYQDKKGDLWLGSDYRGVIKVEYRDKKIVSQHFTTQNGLPKGYTEIVADRDSFYITTNIGLYKASRSSNHKTKFSRYNLFLNQSPSLRYLTDDLIPDKKGNIWVVTSDSVGYALNKGDGKFKYISKPYRLFDNLGINTVYPDKNGIVWFGTEDMLIRYNEDSHFWNNDKNFKTLITKAVVSRKNGKDRNIIKYGNWQRHIFVFKSYDNNFRFDFAAPTYINEASIRYRYQLKGYTDTWSKWRKSNFKEYTNLPYGSYTFKVEARNAVGNVGKVSVFHFEISPPWFATMWMMPVYLLVFVGFIFGGKRVWNAYTLNRTRYLEEIICERTNEIKQKNVKLKGSNQKLKELNEVKNEFLSMAGHDLKNPLSGIEGVTRIMIEELSALDTFDKKLVEKNISALKMIHDSSNYMINIINNLLDTTKIESGKIILNPTLIDVNGLVSSVISHCNRHAKAKNITILFQNPEEISIHLDAVRTRQILENILDNAIKYSPLESEISLCVDTNVERIKMGVRITVTDAGPGLTDEDKKELYGKFKRLSARPTGGENSTGLGLYITKSLVELQGGIIDVESEVGKGSTFTIELPDNSPDKKI